MMIGKYVDHIPFHRQLEQFKRVGVHLPASTVNDWFKDVADLLRPLYFRLWELVMQTDYIQSDETTIPVMNDERHKTVKGYIWLVRSVMTGRQFFYYDKGSRSGKVVLKLFGKFRGAIQTDGYERYADESDDHVMGELALQGVPTSPSAEIAICLIMCATDAASDGDKQEATRLTVRARDLVGEEACAAIIKLVRESDAELNAERKAKREAAGSNADGAKEVGDAQ